MITTEQQVAGARRFFQGQQRKGRESVSGQGSNLSHTTEIREWLPQAILRHGIQALIDIPCGDRNWIKHVDLPCEYTGYDVLPELGAPILNAVTDVPPFADCILCRDFLVHLSYEHALKVLDNFRKSGTRFVMLTTFPKEQNTDLPADAKWGWRPLNMQAAPFNMGEPIDGVQEVIAGEKWERWINLYHL